ncbi:MAG: hypothetical protein HY841_13660 [Bacteroidetes bacterium]|nr:hypothetical protein [Bacteroidota bacterium]
MKFGKLKTHITIQHMQELASHRGGKCLSKEYWDSKTKLVWRCEKGHTWDAYPFQIQRGSWCPACGRQKQKNTIEDMKKLAGKRGFKCLSDVYKNSYIKLKWKCGKEHVWMTLPGYVRRGSGCPYCAGKAKRTIQEMKAFAKKKGGECLSEKYINQKTKLKWQCKKGHVWAASPNSIINSNTWCGHCYGHYNLHLSDMQKIAADRGGKCLSAEYINKEVKLRWRCAEGHVWKATSGAIRQGSWCKICSMKANGLKKRKHSLAGLNEIAKAKGGKCLSREKEFLNQYSRLTWQCAKGHKWKATSKSIVNGTWCRLCWLNRGK